MTRTNQGRTIPTEYEAVVFDNDGVIVEPTERARIADAVAETFRSFGVDPDRDHVERTVREAMGPAGTVGDHDLDPAAFWPERERRVAETQMEAMRTGEKALYDDVDVVERLDAGVGMVSNNQDATARFVVEQFGLSAFETVYGREHTVEGARRRKPDPHYVDRALEDLGTRDAVYVGDSETDVEAARAAGLDSAFLRRDHAAGTELSVEPTYDVPDLRALAEAIREDR